MIKSIFVILLSVVAMASAEKLKTNKTCRALALSGGGSKGAYQAGVLYGLVTNEMGDKSKFAYDVVTGVSAGAINSLAISIFQPGDEVNLVQFLSDTWAGLWRGNVYRDWQPFGIVTGVFSRAGIFDTAPLYDFLSGIFQQFGSQIHRKIDVSCVNANTGDYHIFNESTSNIVLATQSSAAIPFIFPTVTWPDGTVCTDAGIVWNTNLDSAVKRCRELVDDDSQIIADAILTTDLDIGRWSRRSNAYANYKRFKEIKDNSRTIGDIRDTMRAYPNVTYRYLVMPSEPLPGGLNLLNFDNQTNTWPMQILGRLDGENAILDEEGWLFSKLRVWDQVPAIQLKYPTIEEYLKDVVFHQSNKRRIERKARMPEPDPNHPEMSDMYYPEEFMDHSFGADEL